MSAPFLVNSRNTDAALARPQLKVDDSVRIDNDRLPAAHIHVSRALVEDLVAALSTYGKWS